MDKATKKALQGPDKFQLATENSVAWAAENRSSVVTWSIVLVVAVLALVGGFAVYQHRVGQAEVAYGDATAIYQTPVADPTQPTPPGTKTYADQKTRAAAANAAFQDVANKFGMTEQGKNAQYMVAVTDLQMGQFGTAEDILKKLSTGWNADIAALAKQSLAQMYQQTGRNAEAVPLYEELAKGSAVTVNPNEARLELAELYSSEGRPADANKLYAEVKDKDKDSKGQPGPAAEIAGEKLKGGK